MARGATLSIGITADPSDAVAGLDKASGAVKEYGDAAGTAAKQSRDISGGIESVGGVAGGVTTGLRDMSDAVAMLGFPEAAAGMQVAAVGFESMDGAATLYAAAQEGASKAAKIFTRVMNVMKVSILTNPIFIIAAILIAIGVAFVILYKKSETFRRIVDGAFRAVWNIIKNVWNWIRHNWPVLLAVLTGPIGIAVLLITRNWDRIRNGVAAVVDFIRRAWSTLTTILAAPYKAAWSVISGIFDKIKSAVQSVIDLIGKIKIPKLPDLNPFNNAAATAAGFAAPRVTSTARTTARAGTVGTVNITVTGALDPDAVARQIRRILSGHARRVGASAAAYGLT